jgi:hypothetical protein
MGAAADDLKLSDEERQNILERRRQQAEAEAEEKDKNAKAEDVATAARRLSDIVSGERPTRESNSEYRFRKMGGEARRSLAR